MNEVQQLIRIAKEILAEPRQYSREQQIEHFSGYAESAMKNAKRELAKRMKSKEGIIRPRISVGKKVDDSIRDALAWGISWQFWWIRWDSWKRKESKMDDFDRLWLIWYSESGTLEMRKNYSGGLLLASKKGVELNDLGKVLNRFAADAVIGAFEKAWGGVPQKQVEELAAHKREQIERVKREQELERKHQQELERIEKEEAERKKREELERQKAEAERRKREQEEAQRRKEEEAKKKQQGLTLESIKDAMEGWSKSGLRDIGEPFINGNVVSIEVRTEYGSSSYEDDEEMDWAEQAAENWLKKKLKYEGWVEGKDVRTSVMYEEKGWVTIDVSPKK